MNQNYIKAVNELKMLAIDMINQSRSGNPGIVMDMAGVMYTLFARELNVYPKEPHFFNRDRVILSSAHISPLYYATLYMAGFELTKEDLQHFRRLNSNTPGLPELNNPLGVEATTGYAGDGVGNAVGIALFRRYIENLIRAEDSKLNLLNLEEYKDIFRRSRTLEFEKIEFNKKLLEKLLEKDYIDLTTAGNISGHW